MEDKVYQYWLCQAEGFGNVKSGYLLDLFGEAKNVYQASVMELGQAMDEANGYCSIRGHRPVFSDQDLGKLIAHKENLEDCLGRYQVMERAGIHFISPKDPVYPQGFHALYDKPQGLFLKGMLPDPKTRNVSIVGARRCTEYGRGIAQELGRCLVHQGVNVISGMAEGIDGASHRGAMDGIYDAYKKKPGQKRGMTVAILGGGVDICYPKCNMDIYKALAMEQSSQELCYGGLLSEQGVGTMPFPGQFPLRNRLISAMSDMLIVVEARSKSGSLISADQALEQGKEVFVIPGRITDPLSEGCNRLIAQGAGIITDIEKFVKEHFYSSLNEGEIKGNLKNKLAMHEELVYSGLDFIPSHMNQILEQTGLEFSILLQTLQNLQRMGLIAEVSKNYYVRKL